MATATPPLSKHSAARRRSLSRRESQDAAMAPVEVSVLALGDDQLDGECSAASSTRQLSRSTTLFISSSGQCSTRCDDEDDEAEEDHSQERWDQYSSDESAMGSSSFGKLGGTLKDRIWLCFLWLKKQRQNKQINAGKDVLSTYHEAFLYGEVPLTTKVRAAVGGGIWSSNLIWLECIAAVISLVFYVRSTYVSDTHHWIITAKCLCYIFFAADYLIKLYSAPVRLYYIFSLNGIIDFISTLPLFFLLGDWRDNGAIPELLLMLRVLRAMPLLSSSALPGGAVGQEIFLLLTYTFGIVFIAAGVLQWVELKATPDSIKQQNHCGAHGCLNFYETFYFLIVTISTVGFGDITPKSEWGRFVVLCTILAALVVIPVEVNKILELASRRPFGGRFAVQKVVGSRFVIISGNLSYRVVQDFLSGFFHPSHEKDMSAFPLRVVIMAPFKPSFEMKVLLTRYKGRVDFIEGTPLNDFDLERVGAEIASAFFLLADQRAKDPDAEDAAQVMRTLSVHRYCGPKVRVIVEMLKPENQDSPIWDDAESGIEILCPDAICYQLLARSCQIKGLSAFVINLFKAGLKINRPTPGHWMQQYYHGMEQGVYPTILPCCFHENRLLFEEAAEIVYLKFHAILFGLDIQVDGDSARDIIVNPKHHQIQPSDVGLVIAKDLNVAENISKFGKKSSKPCACCRAFCGFFRVRSCKERFRTSSMEDEFLILQVTKRRGLKHGDITFDTDFASESEKHREMQKLGGSSFGLMKSGHRVELQTQLREIVCASSIHDSTSRSGKECLSSSQNLQRKCLESKMVFSLEDAVDMAMSWPPVTKSEKPDRPILERRTGAILKNLEERTLSVVTLRVPHVLVCMQGKWPRNLFYFVSHLRMPGLPNPPIVILHPLEPLALDWGCVGMFEDVYFVKGSPIYELDLVRAGVLQAGKVVVLTQHAQDESFQGSYGDSGASTSSSVALDVDNVLITATVERLLHPIRDRVVVELQQEIEIHYLRPKYRIDRRRFDPALYYRNRAATYMFTPAYVEGKGFCSVALNFLLYSLFFNRNTVSIIELFLSGENAWETNGDGGGGQLSLCPKLEQIGLPKCYVGQTFSELFIGLLRQENKLTLGLYRPVGTCDSIVSYVYTNPPPQDVLQHGDLLYVLL